MTKSILTTSGAQRLHLSIALQTFVLADLLFFPRLLFAFGIPISLLVIGATFFYRPFQLMRMVIALALLVLMLSSVTYGAASGQNMIPEESLKRAVQLFTILFYSFYRLDAETVRPVLVNILRCFYVWTFCTMLLFFLHPDIYRQFVAAIYPETLDQLDNTLEIFRFAYIYSDPNSAAYLLCFTLVAYLFFERKLNWGVICTTMALITILATQSRGAYIAVTVILLYFSASLRAPQHKRFLVIISAGLALWSLASYYSEEIDQAYSFFEARFDQEEDLGGGRAGKYKYFLENFNFLPIGSGYHLQKEWVEFRPHSDLIRINLSYGFLALPLFFYFIFPRRKSQVLLFIVFLVPFLINTVIDDYRLFGIYLLLFGLLGQFDSGYTARKPKQNPVI